MLFRSTHPALRFHSFCTSAIVFFLLSGYLAAADKNPWLAIQREAHAFANQVNLDWKANKQQQDESFEFTKLANASEQPFSIEELEALLDHAYTIASPQVWKWHGVDQPPPGIIVETTRETWMLGKIAVARMVHNMPQPERDSFQKIVRWSNLGFDTTLRVAIAAISLKKDASRETWLREFVFNKTDHLEIYHKAKWTAALVLVGLSRESHLETFQQVIKQRQAELDTLAAELRAQSNNTNAPERSTRYRSAAREVFSLQCAASVEAYFQTLDEIKRAAIRDFHLRMQQALACSPRGFRSEDGTVFFATSIMNRKPTDPQFYLAFLQDWNQSNIDIRMISALYRESDDPMDVKQLQAIADSDRHEPARAARDVLWRWEYQKKINQGK